MIINAIDAMAEVVKLLDMRNSPYLFVSAVRKYCSARKIPPHLFNPVLADAEELAYANFGRDITTLDNAESSNIAHKLVIKYGG